MLEESRETLINLVSEKENMLDAMVVNKSQALDQFIVECIKCDKRRIDSKIKTLDNIFGIHSTFYYYGREHLLINLLPYIKHGVENNELITVSFSKDIYHQLMELLESHGIDKSSVIFFPVKDMVMANNKNGLEGVRQLISTLLKGVECKNYKGARIIGQPSFAIGETSKEDFLKLEKVLTDSVIGMNASGLCVYDAFDYIHNGQLIDEYIMNDSFRTHSHLLYNNSLFKFN
ncbi:MEDS domain-containing protein [Robertmurraya korlensis]|uniref:MEDS domain-containing protein n=1 Tax=Robertmurraya korlensis TaxID=519977 RepID=UPI000824A70C|nr:MEDS domain-containing protein [Robertmurraya korlensis]